MSDERELRALLDELENTDEAVVDSSSLIYAEKSGFLNQFTETLRLISIEEVVAETGFFDLDSRLALVPSPSGIGTDAKLVKCAEERKLPLISEDRAILMTCLRIAIPNYNALLLLTLMLLRGSVSSRDFSHFEARLLQVAHYHPEVIRFGREFTQFALKIR